MSSEWGPLAGLIGEWEGVGGLDVAYSHEREEVVETPYSEKVSMKPFGPVRNGRQVLFGLDYRTAMWRGSEADPFHAEVGYRLWDAAAGEVLRCFVVPRGITVTSGGITSAEARTFTMRAAQEGSPYRIGENTYLAAKASTIAYESTVSVGDGTWSYDEVTTLRMAEIPGDFAHTDRNSLIRVV